MNLTKRLLFTGLIGLTVLTLHSCKAKKLAAKPVPIAVSAPAPIEEKKVVPEPEKKEAENQSQQKNQILI